MDSLVSHLVRVRALQPGSLKLDMRLFRQAVRGGSGAEAVSVLAQMAERARLMTLRQQFNEWLPSLKGWPAAGGTCPGLLRVFQSDHQGSQISPNRAWRESRWHADPSCIDHNRSWRA